MSPSSRPRRRRTHAPQSIDRSTVWGDVFQVQSDNVEVRGDVVLATAPAPQHQAMLGWARALADSVRRQEADVRVRLLADDAAPKAADLQFQRADLELVRWRDDGGPGSGSLTTITDFYRSLHRGRLVVLGDAGAGKTVLVMQLLLDLLDAQEQVPDERGCGVPVRLSLPSFEDPRLASPEVPATTVAELLDEWIVRQISGEAHPLNRRQARQLVQAGWVLPILDGLDEMDPEGQDPTRALAVVRALNTPGHHAQQPVVVTCRTDLYRRLERSVGALTRRGEVPVLQDATAITVQPLDPDRVRQHLAYRFPARRPGAEVEDRWRPVTAHVAEHPGSPLARLLRETTAQHQRPGATYSETDVRQWLGTLARHLARDRQRGRSGTDFYAHQLWRVTGSRLPHVLSVVVQGVLTTLLVLLAWVQYHGNTGYWVPPYPAGRALLVAGVGVIGWVVVRSGRTAGRLRGLATSLLRGSSGRTRFLVAVGCLVVGLAISSAYGLWFSQGYGPRIGNAYGLAFVSVALIIAGEFAVAHRPAAVSRPSQLLRRALAFQVVLLACYGLAVSGAFGAANLAAYPWLSWTAFSDGAVFGLCVGLAIGIGRTCDSAWTLYAAAVVVLIARHQFPPRRLGPFLDWAYEAGLLRLSGIAIQFRHHALQDWISRDTTRPDTGR